MSERKYRQRGYQDEPRERRAARGEDAGRSRRARAPGRQLQDAEGPRTPNLMASHEVFRCARCGNRLALPVRDDARCARCGVDLHSCVQCVSFDTGARFECTQQTSRPASRPRTRATRAPFRAAHDRRAADGNSRADERAPGVRRPLQIVAGGRRLAAGLTGGRSPLMALISAADQERLREAFAAMTRPVRLLFFTQTLDCETCLQTRQILDELPPLSDRITIEEVNVILDAGTGGAVRHRPRAGHRVLGQDEQGGDRRLADPLPRRAGRLRIHLARAGGPARRRPAPRACRPKTSRASPPSHQPMTIQVFTTPTCPHCPRAVMLAHEMAFANRTSRPSPSRPPNFPTWPGATR